MRVDTQLDVRPLGGYSVKTETTTDDINAYLRSQGATNEPETIIEASSEPIESVSYTTTEPIKKTSKEANAFPIHVLPQVPREYFKSLNIAQGMNIDFMATTFLTEVSGLFGNSKRLEIEYGRSVQMNMYSANVGNSGDGKTPASNYASSPFKDRDNIKVKEYREELSKWNSEGDAPRPVNKAYQVKDVTPEMRFIKMQNVPRGVHQSVDELATIFEQESKENTSSVLLSAWSNEGLKQERASQHIQDRFVTRAGFSISGGIQPKVLYNNYDKGKANGLMARFLFAFPTPKLVLRTTSRKARREALISSEIYDKYVGDLFSDSQVDGFEWRYDDTGKIVIENTHVYTEEAEEYFMQLTNESKLLSNHADTNTSMIAVLTKMEDYRAKFSLLLHILHKEQGNEVGIKYVMMAQELCEYYLYCHNKLFTDKKNTEGLSNIVKDNSLSKAQKAKLAKEQGYSITATARALGVSESSVKNYRRA